MSNRELPMMPWFPQDFASATVHWAFAERGAYRALLDAQWTLGGLSTDERRLARIVGMTDVEFAEVWPLVRTKFELVDGQLKNKRLEEHRLEALRLKNARAKGAQTANAKRSAHIYESERSAPQSATAERGSERTAERAHPSPSPSIREEKNPPTPLRGGPGLLTQTGRKPRDVRTASNAAWGSVVEGAARAYQREGIERDDPTLASAVRKMGGWSLFGQSSALGTLKAPFRELYEQLIEHESADQAATA